MDAYRIGEEIREGDLSITREAFEYRLVQSGIDPVSLRAGDSTETSQKSRGGTSKINE